MEQICPYEECTGCAACRNICPTATISMVEEGPCGFIHPSINQDLCINCNLCRKVCPVINPVKLSPPFNAFAAVSKSSPDYRESASGGAASSLALSVLNKGGVIYGCESVNWLIIQHSRFSSSQSVPAMRGSKYVQSSIGEIFKQVKKDLNSQLQVMFTGTPCQIAGLKRFLMKDYENLITVDLVCHGVSSHKLLRDNVKEMLQHYGLHPDNSTKIWFREKSDKPNPHIDYGVFINNSAIKRSCQLLPRNNYIAAFMASLSFRDNCYKCPYACGNRCSDITVGDFWGLGKDCKIPIENGVSLIMVNSPKGKQFLEENRKLFFIEERSIEEAINGNSHLKSPSSMPAARAYFLDNYAKMPQKAYEISLSQYRKQFYQRQTKLKIKKILKSIPGVKLLLVGRRKLIQK